MPVNTLNGWTSGGLSPSYATVASILGDSSSHFHPLNIPGGATPPGAATTPGAPTGTPMPRPTSYGILGAPAGAAFDLASRVLGRNPFQSGTSSGSAGLSPELWASLNPALQNNILSVYGARGGATATGASGKTGGLAPIVFNHLGETAQRNLLQAYNKNSAAAGAANPLSSMPVPAANIPGQPAPAGTGNFLGLNPQYANYLTGWVGGGFG